jgi:hypothetical protein
VVIDAHVLTHGPRIVCFQHGPVELGRTSTCHALPELLRRGYICGLVDVDAEPQLPRLDTSLAKEAQRELDQPRVAVDKDDPLLAVVRLALGALAPVGDRPAMRISRLDSTPIWPAAAARTASRWASRAGRSASQYSRDPSADRLRHSS